MGDVEVARRHAQGSRLHGNPMYCGRALVIFTLSLACTRWSAACYAALDEYENWMRAKTTPLPPFVKRTEDPDFQRWYGWRWPRSAWPRRRS